MYKTFLSSSFLARVIDWVIHSQLESLFIAVENAINEFPRADSNKGDSSERLFFNAYGLDKQQSKKK